MKKSKKLTRFFYNQPTLKVAQELLGKFLVHRINKRRIEGRIIETEAYISSKDKASHASRGRTPRTELMFGKAGRTYIYLIYGMYYCFNIVTERKGFPAAVLIRAVEPRLAGETSTFHLRRSKKISSGPGKLCQYLKIDQKLNGVDLTGNVLWIEDKGEKKRGRGVQIGRAKRIGVDYAGKYKDKLWRFYIKGNPFVSKI